MPYTRSKAIHNGIISYINLLLSEECDGYSTSSYGIYTPLICGDYNINTISIALLGVYNHKDKLNGSGVYVRALRSAVPHPTKLYERVQPAPNTVLTCNDHGTMFTFRYELCTCLSTHLNVLTKKS